MKVLTDKDVMLRHGRGSDGGFLMQEKPLPPWAMLQPALILPLILVDGIEGAPTLFSIGRVCPRVAADNVPMNLTDLEAPASVNSVLLLPPLLGLLERDSAGLDPASDSESESEVFGVWVAGEMLLPAGRALSSRFSCSSPSTPVLPSPSVFFTFSMHCLTLMR